MANKQKLAATVTIGAVLQGSVKKNIGVLRSGLDSVGSAIKSVTAQQREMSKQRAELVKQGKSVEALDREYESLGRTLADLERKQKRWQNAMQASARVGKSFGNMRRELGALARKTAVAGAAVGAAIFGIADSTATLGDDVAKTADKLGVGIEALQELRYAGERSGVAVETLDKGLEGFSRRLGEAAKGGGSAAKVLKDLGLSAKDLAKLKPEEALGLIADKIQGMDSASEQAAVSMALFGRSGIDMINMLRGGSEGLTKLREDARATGYVLSEKAARDAEVFKDTLLDTQLAVAGLKNTIGAALMPVVTRVMGNLGDALIKNRGLVVAFADDFAAGLERAIPVIGSVLTGMGRVSAQVGTVIAQVVEMVGGWENFGIALGAVFAGKAILSVGAFVLSVVRLGGAMVTLTGALPLVAAGIKAVGVALVANPIGATIAVIAGGALLIMTNWERIEPVIRPILDWMGEKFTWLWQEIGRPMVDGFVEGVQLLGSAWTLFKSETGPVFEWLGGKLLWVWDNGGKPLVDGLRYGVEGIGAAWTGLKETLGAVLDWMGEKFDWILRKLQPVIDGFSKVGDGIKAVGSWVGLGDGDKKPAAGGAGGTWANPQKRAAGGAYAPGWRLVGEKGPELEYQSRGGFIAHNAALQRLSDMAGRARSAVGSGGAGGRAGGGNQVVQNITINALGASAAQVAEEIARRGRSASSGALFDQPAGFGQYGGA
jgi:hypothetical protein